MAEFKSQPSASNTVNLRVSDLARDRIVQPKDSEVWGLRLPVTHTLNLVEALTTTMKTTGHHLVSHIAIAVAVCLSLTCSEAWPADDLPTGNFRRYEGRHIVLITDVPESSQVQELTAAFDAGVNQWCARFGVPEKRVEDWRVKAFLMTDRTRFENAGFVNRGMRQFREGHQEGDLIYCKDQPSEYYRRHLLLHEGVHWFMSRAVGGYGPSWWMEGTAEWLSTHRWRNNQLESGVMPNSREDFVYWGRLQCIALDLDRDQAPSVANIIRRTTPLPSIDSEYAWSWLLVTFFANHPRYQALFNERLKANTSSEQALNSDVMAWIGVDFDLLQAEFDAFATELTYGVDPSWAIVDLKSSQQNQDDSPNFDLTVNANANWQVAATNLSPDTDWQIEATGEVRLASEFGPLKCQPQGITLRYVDGQPRGRLLAILLAQPSKADKTKRLTALPIGRSGQIHVDQPSYLLLRVNDENSIAPKNDGQFEVTLRRLTP